MSKPETREQDTNIAGAAAGADARRADRAGPDCAAPAAAAQSAAQGYGLRQAKAQDVAQIHALMREMAEFENLTAIFQATEGSLHASLFGEQPAARALVAHPEGRPGTVIAYALWFHNYSSFLDKRGLYLEDIYVQAAHRGRGIGRMVLRHLARLAVELDCGRFEWTVLDWNRNAIDFYESHGASVLPDWRIVRLTGEPLRRLAGTEAGNGAGAGEA